MTCGPHSNIVELNAGVFCCVSFCSCCCRSTLTFIALLHKAQITTLKCLWLTLSWTWLRRLSERWWLHWRHWQQQRLESRLCKVWLVLCQSLLSFNKNISYDWTLFWLVFVFVFVIFSFSHLTYSTWSNVLFLMTNLTSDYKNPVKLLRWHKTSSLFYSQCLHAVLLFESSVSWLWWSVDVSEGETGGGWTGNDSKELVGCEKDWRLQFLVS